MDRFLLLLTCTLVFNYIHPQRGADAQSMFTIRNISISLEPESNVMRGTNVTVRCQALVSISGTGPLSREYTIYKDSVIVYTKTTSSSDDLLYRLPDARVFNTGKYKCKINIEGRKLTSEAKKLSVTGLSAPLLHLNNAVISEGEELTARCTAPGETGAIIFYFYDDTKEILEDRVNSNQSEVKLRFNRVGIHKMYCSYTVFVTPQPFLSSKSNTVTISVKELSITPVLEIFPYSKIYEGDRLDIMCGIRDLMPDMEGNVHLYLSRGTQLLRRGNTNVNHSMIALAKDTEEFECRLEMGNVVKVDTKKVAVTELFSMPTLTMSPSEVFQREYMTLSCKSDSVASERIHRDELTYTLDPPESLLIPKSTGVFYGKALLYDFNYTCIAQAKGIRKYSQPLTVRPKVTVSTPKISVVGRAVLGRPFKILCQSDTGSLPINYTLLKEYQQLSVASVKMPFEQALFTVTVNHPGEINKFMCEAKNSQREAPLSKRLDAAVVVPLSHPTLTVIPNLPEIAEGDHLFLICGVKGTPPITFKWYRDDSNKPVFTTTSDKNNTDYQIEALGKDDSGTYYCEALNHANNVVRSAQVTIEVRLALWKKVVIGGFCLLVLSVVVIVIVLCFRSKRGKREAAAELSVKPSSPKSDDSLTVSLTRDTEVNNAAPGKVERVDISVWSERPPQTANDEESSMVSNEPDVEYTEVVHPQPTDISRAPLRKGTETVYSELQNSPHGADDPPGYGSVEYADLNVEQHEMNHYPVEHTDCQDLPVPVD
ncbi:platelet endothelial cell adhesion molecule isoform X1 [Corythoichthys intestinalis]|uniref:platelet endothelial cell adhesion molecule isoform X1 n=1 Tax=Corythoichthys intestinalis TaxID=161448 RepID=UPI0025A6149A|nr:platelet endothelial cell adhesion molecule isoform X1 [Corythoichthys intestinalis]XP_061791350.1 platelet endothelial cell adhesion molecule [Nerophis lumbriciformis]